MPPISKRLASEEAARRRSIRKLKSTRADKLVEQALQLDAAMKEQARAGLPFVARELHAKADLFAERNKLYGDNYLRFGRIMMALHPDGINLSSEDDMSRVGIYIQIVSKVSRYANNFDRGGHKDSLDDISVYSMMLAEVDAIAAKRKAGKK